MIAPQRYGYTVQIPDADLVCDECGGSLVGLTSFATGGPGIYAHRECSPVLMAADKWLAQMHARND